VIRLQEDKRAQKGFWAKQQERGKCPFYCLLLCLVLGQTDTPGISGGDELVLLSLRRGDLIY